MSERGPAPRPKRALLNGPSRRADEAGRATYKGLLILASNRFSRGYQWLASWAYSSNTGINALTASNNTAIGFNLDDWLINRGPLANDITNIVNLAGVGQLPWSFRLGFNFSYSSTRPSVRLSAGKISTVTEQQTICYLEQL